MGPHFGTGSSLPKLPFFQGQLRAQIDPQYCQLAIQDLGTQTLK